jgi:RNA polymerase sigma-70 factor (ECF subfamily)
LRPVQPAMTTAAERWAPDTASGPGSSDAKASGAVDLPSFSEVYRLHFAFVWRSVRRLGIPHAEVDDVVQEIFVIVHRKLAGFEGRSQLRTWLFGVLRRVVRDQRRAIAARPTLARVPVTADSGASPEQVLERARALRTLYSLLDTLDDDKREVFVLVELESMTAPQVAEATGTNLNTVYARLRAARQQLAAALHRYRAREAGTAPGGAR